MVWVGKPSDHPAPPLCHGQGYVPRAQVAQKSQLKDGKCWFPWKTRTEGSTSLTGLKSHLCRTLRASGGHWWPRPVAKSHPGCPAGTTLRPKVAPFPQLGNRCVFFSFLRKEPQKQSRQLGIFRSEMPEFGSEIPLPP